MNVTKSAVAAVGFNGHIKNAQQQTVIQQYGDWYTGRWLMGRYIWYSEEGGLLPAQSPPRCIKCNSLPINGQCTNFVLFDVAIPVSTKGLNQRWNDILDDVKTDTWMQQWLLADSRFWQASSNHVGRRTTIVSVDSETSLVETQSQNSSRRSWQNWSHAWNSSVDFTPSSIATSLNCQSHAIQFNHLSTWH